MHTLSCPWALGYTVLTSSRTADRARAHSTQRSEGVKRRSQPDARRFVAAVGSGCCGLGVPGLAAPVRPSLCAARLSAAFGSYPACLCCQAWPLKSRRACVARGTSRSVAPCLWLGRATRWPHPLHNLSAKVALRSGSTSNSLPTRDHPPSTPARRQAVGCKWLICVRRRSA